MKKDLKSMVVREIIKHLESGDLDGISIDRIRFKILGFGKELCLNKIESRHILTNNPSYLFGMIEDYVRNENYYPIDDDYCDTFKDVVKYMIPKIIKELPMIKKDVNIYTTIIDENIRNEIIKQLKDLN